MLVEGVFVTVKHQLLIVDERRDPLRGASIQAVIKLDKFVHLFFRGCINTFQTYHGNLFKTLNWMKIGDVKSIHPTLEKTSKKKQAAMNLYETTARVDMLRGGTYTCQ
jgi:hypothetical protein